MADRREVLKGAIGIAAGTALAGSACAEPVKASIPSAPPAPLTGQEEVHNWIESYFKQVGRYAPQVEAVRHIVAEANHRLIVDNPDLFDPAMFARAEDVAVIHRHTQRLHEPLWEFEKEPTEFDVRLAPSREAVARLAKDSISELRSLHDRINKVATNRHSSVTQPFRWLIPLVTTGVQLSQRTFEPEALFATRYALRIDWS